MVAPTPDNLRFPNWLWLQPGRPTRHWNRDARDGSSDLDSDPCPYPYPAGSSMAEGVTADFEGHVYGADFLGDVRKFVKK